MDGLRLHFMILVVLLFICGGHSARKNRLGELENFWFGNFNSKRSLSSVSADRRSRFLSLFTYVQFENQECVGSEGDYGTCLNAEECARRGGTGSGACAEGYGTCCLILVSCGRTIRDNGTYFVNNGYPNQYDGTDSCQVTMIKSNPDVCQFRLDFSELSLIGPETENHICSNDQFIVSGGNPVPTICGNSMGNHIYVDAGTSVDNPITLSVVTSGPSFGRFWKVRVLQIPCNINKADEGCLQYFTGVAGRITSFNYDPADGAQLSNQDYGICIRAERDFCGIQYTQCTDVDETENNLSQSFTLSGNSNERVQAMVGSTGSSNFCQADYLIIPMASNVGRAPTGPSATVDRICGGVLSADVTFTPTTVRSSARPFRLYFHTDDLEAPNDVDNKGFCINYIQQPCTSSLS